MRKLAMGLALASTALASPALAKEGQWYIGVDAGAMIAFNKVIKVPHTARSDHGNIHCVRNGFGQGQVKARLGAVAIH